MEKAKQVFNKVVHWQYLMLLVLLLMVLGLHLATITRPNQLIFDENYYVPDARLIIKGEGTQRLEQPPLAKLIIAGGIEVFGDNPWGWRMPAILFSTVAMIFFYNICLRLGTSHKTSFLATLLLSTENLTFIQSGLAMLDIYVVVFTVCAFWLYLKGPRWWWAAAISVALAALSKFSGMLSIIPIGLHWFIIGRKSKIDNQPGRAYSRYVSFFLSMALALVAFFMLYGVFDMIMWAKWIPFLTSRPGGQSILGDIKNALSLTNSIKFTYSRAFPARPWEWILSPTGSFNFYGWLFHPYNYEKILLQYSILPSYTCMLSPSLWLSGLAVIPFAIWQSLKKNNAAVFVVCWIIGTWFTWIPLFLATDRLTYMFYYLPTIGAIALGTALILNTFLNKAKGNPKSFYGRFLELITASFILLHLMSLCVLSPLHLWISIPICTLLLILTLGFLGLGWRFNIEFYASIVMAVLTVRFALYQSLERWLLKGFARFALGGVYRPLVAAVLIGLAISWLLFTIVHFTVCMSKKAIQTYAMHQTPLK